MATLSGKRKAILPVAGSLVPGFRLQGPVSVGVGYSLERSAEEDFRELLDAHLGSSVPHASTSDARADVSGAANAQADLAFLVSSAVEVLADVSGATDQSFAAATGTRLTTAGDACHLAGTLVAVLGACTVCADIELEVTEPGYEPDEEDYPLPGPATPAGGRSQASTPLPALEFLGRGLRFPFTFQRRSGGTQISTATSSDHAHIHESIRQILGTRRGERFLRPGFGSDLHKLVFEPNDRVLYGLIRHEVMTALDEWEPRVILTDVSVGPAEDDLHLVLIHISYRLIAGQVEGNLVYPFARELE